jgi:hypothetical protein
LFGEPSAEPSGAFEWNLNLPGSPVSRRVSRGGWDTPPNEPLVLADIKGAGCIRRLWFTGSHPGRQFILRIYFDGWEVPYVEAPLSDFFGVMHDLAGKDEPYRINTPFLDVKPHNSMTCYFPMPFASSARVELVRSGKKTREGGSSLYYMIDWHEYPGQEMKEPMRFCARWRREAPARAYQDEYLLLDADGPGQLVGFVYSVDMLQSRQTMRWSHAGADNIYLDGDGDHPAYLRGIGGEDTFGTSYGGADYPAQTSLVADMPYYVQKDPEGDKQKMVGYRFFASDAVHFQRSIHLRFACRAHDIASTVYWYSTKPVRPFFTMPPLEKRLPGSEVRRGEYDLPLPKCGQWWIAGPFSTPFEKPLPVAEDFDAHAPYQNRLWQTYAALHGFVDFNHVYRPDPSNDNSPTLDATAVACCVLESPCNTEARFMLGWDDQLVLQVNGGQPIDLGQQDYLRAQAVEVPLHQGKNFVALRLTNTVGLTRGSWAFSFRATTADGQVLLPKAVDAQQ